MNPSQYSAPSFLAPFISYDHPTAFEKMIDIEWRGQIQSSTQNKKFKIKYYGELFEEYQLITGTDFAPELIYAVDVDTQEEILLFDGCKHGYDSMFCDEYSPEQINNRPVTQFFTDANGEDTFEVIVSVYHNIDYDEELDDFVNDEGDIPLIHGEIIDLATLKSDGFDVFQIIVIDAQGKHAAIHQRELA